MKPFICAIAGLVLCQAAAAETPVEAWPKHVIAEGFVSQTAVAADFTGDERIDVIASDITAGNEKLMLYVGPDWKPVVLGQGIRSIYAVALDVNKDGRTDVICARYHPGLIYWLEQPKMRVHDRWTYRVVDDAADGGADGVHGLQTGDVDKDGSLDLVGSSGQPNGPMKDALVWYSVPKGQKANERWPRVALANGDAPGLSHYVALADVNGDGRPTLPAPRRTLREATGSPGGNRVKTRANLGSSI